MSNKSISYPCPCCGYLTLSEDTHDTFEICPVCNWEDDDIQFKYPDFSGGANQLSLNEARKNFKVFGASSTKYIKNVRPPILSELPISQTTKKTAFNCRVCGFDQGFEPWGEDGETPTFDICSCCGVQFGYEDCNEFYVKKFRQEWMNNGAKWFTPKDMPPNWSLEEQMKGIPDQFK